MAICNVLSLQDLKSCVNLKWLSLIQNKLHSLKGVECLTKLTVLNAGKNQLRSMDEVRSVVTLRALILNDNEITSICPLDQLKELNTLGTIYYDFLCYLLILVCHPSNHNSHYDLSICKSSGLTYHNIPNYYNTFCSWNLRYWTDQQVQTPEVGISNANGYLDDSSIEHPGLVKHN
ncbi:hypothetical protein QQ045_017902 [Rhodiola kirilowii]